MTSLSICIPSYNRPVELLRAITSIKLNDSIDYEIVVVDDCSPRQDLISQNIYNLNNPKVRYFPLKSNVGYDLNLLNCVKYSSKDYVLLLSDDDSFDSLSFPAFFENLQRHSPCIATVAHKEQGSPYSLRQYGKVKCITPKSAFQLSSILYNFILFSGVIVNRKYFIALLPLKVDGLVYSQLLWSSLLSIKYGYYSFPQALITIHGDGEIGFGSNASQDTDILLSNRKMLLSPISYHRKLFCSVQALSSLSNMPRLQFYFSLEYTLRSYYLMKRAYIIGGRKALLEFFRTIAREPEIKLFLPLTCVYFLVIYFAGLRFEKLFTSLFGSSPSMFYRKVKGGD